MQNGSLLSVKQLNFYVRSLIEGDPRLNCVSVTGEISNFKNHYSSGHLYFTLKDNDASIKCVMFKGYARSVKFDISDGMQVVLRGRVSLYEKDGQYQFYAEEMMPSGLGDITLKFNQIKEKLQNEGLFDSATKRPIPKFPQKIAVVTSPTGAAVQDILNILSRRWPIAEVILCPVSVQGELAVPEICETLDKLYTLSVANLIILGRGGGSIEDLWAFNDEKLARKVYESPVPVISAVGHETDFTICDFVADLRAPTPSAAAELAVPDIEEINFKLNKYKTILKTSLLTTFNLSKAKFERLTSNKYFENPVDSIINTRTENLDNLYDKLFNLKRDLFLEFDRKITENALKLDTLSPLKTLARGYASITKDEKTVTSVSQLNIGDCVTALFKDGNSILEVKEIK